MPCSEGYPTRREAVVSPIPDWGAISFALTIFSQFARIMTVRFSVERWAAWAPGLNDHMAWRAWLREPCAISQQEEPPLVEMPAMIRRRVERLGRVALQATYWGQGDCVQCPIVFASRRGDIGRSIQLLCQLATGEPLSPAAFSTSVHNAIGALYSIANTHTGPYTAIAAGEETVEAAFVEALGQLADGEPEVLLVYYDEPLPVPYDVFQDGFDFKFEFVRAMAYRIRLVEMGGCSLQSGPAIADAERNQSVVTLPPDVAVLNFLVSDTESQYVHTVGARRWEWSRHA